jgi:hypothetical protein
VVDQQAQVVDVVTELDGPEPEQATAEVVQLPTNPH